MTLHRTGFTLVELMIVIAIIGIISASIYPAMSGYYARGRDTARISDIKDISARFQDYSRTYSTYPRNTNISGVISYCISDIRGWVSAGAGIKDQQFSQLGGTGALKSDPVLSNPAFTSNSTLGCSQTGSYLYANLLGETNYAVLAARMERQTTGANYALPLRLTNPTYINEMVIARPLDKSGNDTDKIFLIITN